VLEEPVKIVPEQTMAIRLQVEGDHFAVVR
jgi:hypothetical protein